VADDRARSPFALRDATAVVTGATGGIGQSVVAVLLEAGARVAAVDLDGGAAADLAARHGDRCVGIAADVTDPEALAAAVARAEDHLGPLRYGVNCAGINNQVAATEMSAEVWRSLLDVNLTGVFLACQAEARAMSAHGGGAVVNIGSVSATIANRGLTQAHYNAAKAGVVHLTTSLALEWAPLGVRVNSVSPGYTRTAMVVAAWDRIKDVVEDIPAGRMAEPREIGLAVQYLLSDAAGYVVGEDLIVDGGHSRW
jgi:NAD(P)-dependent dehydrogenase (short-subunit alcohol dehydrogenase family)